MEKTSLDRFDKRILDQVQRDADLSLEELAGRVGLSRNPCWRRLQKLQAAGVIRRKVALLDPQAVNLGITVFVKIRTSEHTAEWLERFARAVRGIAEVTEFYRMAGDMDYLLKVMVPTIDAYDGVYKRLIDAVELHDVSSYFAMEELKNTTALPLDYA